MSNIYFKVTIEMFLKLRFSGFKKHWILELPVATKKSDIWEKNCVWLLCMFAKCKDFVIFLNLPNFLFTKDSDQKIFKFCKLCQVLWKEFLTIHC